MYCNREYVFAYMRVYFSFPLSGFTSGARVINNYHNSKDKIYFILVDVIALMTAKGAPTSSSFNAKIAKMLDSRSQVQTTPTALRFL